MSYIFFFFPAKQALLSIFLILIGRANSLTRLALITSKPTSRTAAAAAYYFIALTASYVQQPGWRGQSQLGDGGKANQFKSDELSSRFFERQ
jgi:hypothetical protein